MCHLLDCQIYASNRITASGKEVWQRFLGRGGGSGLGGQSRFHIVAVLTHR